MIPHAESPDTYGSPPPKCMLLLWQGLGGGHLGSMAHHTIPSTIQRCTMYNEIAACSLLFVLLAFVPLHENEHESQQHTEQKH